MWQLVLLAAAVAGSTGFATIHFLTHHHYNNTHPPHDGNANNTEEDPNANASYQSDSDTRDDGSSGSLRQHGSHSRGSNRVPKVEHRRLLPFCLNKRKTTNKVLAIKPPFSSSKDNSFGWGLAFAIMYMMSSGKAEINKLNKTMDEIATSVQELKSELNRRKSSRAHQILDSDGHIDMNSYKMSGRHNEVMLKKTNSEFRDTDVKIWSPVIDGGECGSSTLTEEPEPQVLEMDQLEAELEFELQKLSGCSSDRPCHEEIRPKLYEIEVQDEGCNGTDDPNFNYPQSHGVLPSELNQKLSHLLIKQQEDQIAELESELNLAQSNLHQKEAELQALKDCVRCLTELSISTVSEDETQALTDPKITSALDNINIESESKQSVVVAKRPFDSESCSYCMLNDYDLCEHTTIQGI